MESFDSSDEEIINQNASPPDEGYASQDASSDELEIIGDPKKKDIVAYKDWEASEEEVDDDGNLRGFIEDEAEESGEDLNGEDMDVDADADGDERCLCLSFLFYVY